MSYKELEESFSRFKNFINGNNIPIKIKIQYGEKFLNNKLKEICDLLLDADVSIELDYDEYIYKIYQINKNGIKIYHSCEDEEQNKKIELHYKIINFLYYDVYDFEKIIDECNYDIIEHGKMYTERSEIYNTCIKNKIFDYIAQSYLM